MRAPSSSPLGLCNIRHLSRDFSKEATENTEDTEPWEPPSSLRGFVVIQDQERESRPPHNRRAGAGQNRNEHAAKPRSNQGLTGRVVTGVSQRALGRRKKPHTAMRNDFTHQRACILANRLARFQTEFLKLGARAGRQARGRRRCAIFAGRRN